MMNIHKRASNNHSHTSGFKKPIFREGDLTPRLSVRRRNWRAGIKTGRQMFYTEFHSDALTDA